MAADKGKRLNQIAKEVNVGIHTLVEFLAKKGHEVSPDPNNKISGELYGLLLKQFLPDKYVKEEVEETRKKFQALDKRREKKSDNSLTEDETPENVLQTRTEQEDILSEQKGLKIIGKIDLSPPSNSHRSETTETSEHKLQVETENSESKEEDSHLKISQVEKLNVENISTNELETVTKIETDIKPETIQNIVNQEDKENVTHDNNFEDEDYDLNITDAVAENENKAGNVSTSVSKSNIYDTKESDVEENFEESNLDENDFEEDIDDESDFIHKTIDEDEDDSELETIVVKSTIIIEDEPILPSAIKIKEEHGPKIIGKIDLDALNQKMRPERKKTSAERRKEREAREKASKDAIDRKKVLRKIEEDATQKLTGSPTEKNLQTESGNLTPDDNFIKTKIPQLAGPKVITTIELTDELKSDKNKKKAERKRKRNRIRKPVDSSKVAAPKSESTTKEHDKIKPVEKKLVKKKAETKRPIKVEIDEEDVNAQVKETLARLTVKGKKKAVKHRKDKREVIRKRMQDEADMLEQEESKLRVTEFVSANELAVMMDVSVNEIIATCFDLGKMITINSRMDAELISFIAEEYGFEVEFISAADADIVEEVEDTPEELKTRPPIVTVMGHVDHGKTSLLDYIRKTNVIAGEAGGITQHIGAYNVTLPDGSQITFLDTPGHEAFTAMRARGAKVTDLAIIVVAADDNIMPQTEEAINHAKAANVPIIFAINKIDKDGANPDKIKEALAARNLLVEEWGGKYQSTDISAKKGLNIEKLMEEVLLAAEVLDLKANPDRMAKGTVIEAALDPGRGYVSTLLVQNGTLRQGDVILAGAFSGKVKAIFNEKKKEIKSAGPSTPILVLGLDGAPQAGDTFRVMESEKDAREIANKNKRLQREQTLRAHKHITLDEIGRRLKLGNFQRLNVIIKGDVIGSVEALADSLIKLSTEEIELHVIHKGVGQISEADVMLATASDAIILGFQVRPSTAARKLAEVEEIDIRLYSVIYSAIEEVRAAMEGMLSPEIKEEIVGTIEVRTVFKISKIGNIAGCYVLDGKVNKDDRIRLIRDGIVVNTTKLASLKRFKEDVKEVSRGYECGLNLHNFEDIREGDIIEAFKEVEVAKKLE